MNRESYKAPVFLIVAMWLALPVSWMEYRQNWDQLPERMAVHFDADRHPNGFTSRQGALNLGLGIMGLLLALLTVVSFAIRALKPQASWPALVTAYAVLGVCWYGNHQIIKFNLEAQSARVEQGSSQLSLLSCASTEHLSSRAVVTEN